jgi:hypothetical protein
LCTEKKFLQKITWRKEIGKVTLSVVFVIRRRQFNTSLLIVHLQKKMEDFPHEFYNPAPSNIDNMFGNWLNEITTKDKGFIRVGVCALLWSIWKVRNDFIFNKTAFPPFLQVISLTMHWIHM